MNDAIFVPDENIPLVTYNNEDGEDVPNDDYEDAYDD